MPISCRPKTSTSTVTVADWRCPCYILLCNEHTTSWREQVRQPAAVLGEGDADVGMDSEVIVKLKLVHQWFRQYAEELESAMGKTYHDGCSEFRTAREAFMKHWNHDLLRPIKREENAYITVAMVTYYYQQLLKLDADSYWSRAQLQSVASDLTDVLCNIHVSMERWNEVKVMLPSPHISPPTFLTRNTGVIRGWLIIISFCASTIQQLIGELSKPPVY